MDESQKHVAQKKLDTNTYYMKSKMGMMIEIWSTGGGRRGGCWLLTAKEIEGKGSIIYYLFIYIEFIAVTLVNKIT